MEIFVSTSRYTAEQLQQHLNPNGTIMGIILGGDHTNDYSVIVDNDIKAKLVTGMLKHLGIEIQKSKHG